MTATRSTGRTRARRAVFAALLTAAVLVWTTTTPGTEGAAAEVTGAENPAAEGTFVQGAGTEVCAQCHDDVAAGLSGTVHGRGTVRPWDGSSACESCHGPGQEHAESGEAAAILGGRTAGATERCVSCHGGGTAAHWRASSHDEFGVVCADCHKVHVPWSESGRGRNETVTDGCLTCHQEKRKHLFQRSSHPLRFGLMSCISCHSPHGSPTESAISAVTPNDKCYECHADKRGPFLYEHQPVREDCTTCHDPHGSNQTMMLQTSAPRLCQSCHLFGHHQTVPGEPGQIWNQNRSCVNCHFRIHGSNHPSGVVFLR